MKQMNTVVALSTLVSLLSVSGALALDPDTIQNYMNQVQSLQSDIAKEHGIRQDLLKTKELLLELDKTNKEETAKLKQHEASLLADVNAYKSEKSALGEEQKRFQTELASVQAQRDRNQEEIGQHAELYNRHQSWKLDRYNGAAVNAYNAEADQLNVKARSLNAQKAQLDAAKAHVLNRVDALDKRETASEQKRRALVERNKALEKKDSDLTWAREKGNEQTLKWAADTKRNNARSEELAGQLNALLTKVSQMSSRCSSISGVGTLDLTSLNSASEQASHCLQQIWDGAGPRDAAAVKPKPGYKVTPNK